MILDDLRRDFDALKRKVAAIEAQIAEHGPLERRLRSHVDDKNDDFKLAVEERIKSVIQSEMSAVTSALKPIEDFMREQGSRDEERLERERREHQIRVDTQNEMIAEDLRIAARVAEALAEKKTGAEITGIHVKTDAEKAATPDVLDSRIDGAHKRKVASLVVLISLITALTGLIGAAFGSHSTTAVVTPLPGGSHH